MGTLDSEQYSKAAEECGREAERALTEFDRARWVKLAADWTDPARTAEEKSG
jgi:hypothetical protein